MKNSISVAIVLFVGFFATSVAQQPARVIVSIPEAPIFLRPDNRTQPLRMAKEGSSLVVVKAESGWYQVEFQDPQYGRRIGFVEERFVEALSTPPLDLSVPVPAIDTPAVKAPQARALPSPTMPGSPRSANQTFQKAKLSLQVDDKTEAVDVVVRYDDAALIVSDKKTNHSLKTLPYAEITGGEYSFAKSPRWKTALLVSPLFLFTSGKKHWFLAQGKNDHALLHLDKENYRLILATFETKTGTKVETVADSK